MTGVMEESDSTPVRMLGRPRSSSLGQAILRATLDILGECGTDGLTIEAVAHRAGVGKATVYRRWACKEDLIFAALASMREDLPELPGTSLRDDLVTFVGYLLHSMTESVDGAVFSRLLGEVDQHRGLVAQYHEYVVSPRRECFGEALERGVANGELREDVDVDVLRHMVIGGLLHTVWVSQLHAQPLPDDVAERMVDTILRGVAPDPR